MKRKAFLVLLILSLFWGSVSVWAEEDGEWIPENLFFEEHIEECVVLNREYYANGPNEKVIVYESPASCQVVETMENGDIVRIDYTYTNSDGIEWGFCEFEGRYGWLPMPYMMLVYDYLCFEEEYGAQIQEELGYTDDMTYAGPSASKEEWDVIYAYRSGHRRVKFWTYPGSSRYFSIKMGWWGNGLPTYKKVFVDEEGRKWGFVDYYFGEHMNRWICINSLSEMVADVDELYPNGAPIRDTRVVTAYEGEEIFPDDYEHVQKMKVVKQAATVVGIIVVVIAAVLFYWRMWKKVKQA